LRGLVGLFVVLLLVGCTSEPQLAASHPSPTPSLLPSPSATPSEAGWDLDADIGAVIVLSWQGKYGWSTIATLMTQYKLGGVLLFTPNFGGTPAGVKQWSDRLHALAQSQCLAHPILTMLDEEGGEVANVKAKWAPPWPSAMAKSGAAAVREYERVNGAGLRAAGVDLNLAPVADVRTNPLDDVIGDRSFGSSSSVVTPLVAAAVQGLHDGGVGATVKHWPGLGGAAGNPHVAIPTDPESEATWERVQLPGFQAAIAAGADAVMVTSVYVPGLGAGKAPAVFSSSVIGRVRTQLGFEGVIMSDSLSMNGIGVKWPLPQAAVMALQAGNDMLLLSNGDPSYEVSAIKAVKAAVLAGRIDRVKLHESAMRVNAMRDRWGRALAPCQAASPA
jgi:beta-N-acetylhexosaminidase